MAESGDSIYRRWWFEAAYEPIRVSEDGLSFGLEGQRMRVLSADPSAPEPENTTAAQYAAVLNENWHALARAIPAFADLENAADAAILAALIRIEKLDQKAGVDLSWAMESGNYPIKPVPIPTHAQTLVNYRKTGTARVGFALGGVIMRPDSIASKDRRAPDTGGELTTLRQRLEGDAWL